ncbi:MAG TPA: hypothetical protein VIM31_03910 [Candidatus Microsaccharimonas sp.]|jgi:hypothetical protein
MIRQHLKTLSLRLLTLVVAVFGILLAPSLVGAANNYSDGSYGACQYNACGISFGASATVNLNIIPDGGGATTCTVNSAEVQVLTDSSTGYTLTVGDNDTSSNMVNASSATIPTLTGGTSASPASLAVNTWGYRVDSIAGFGSGPTSASSNGTIPSLDFAQIPTSSGTSDTIANSSTAADPYVSTFVWYGICADTSTAPGDYTDDVVYTAVVN